MDDLNKVFLEDLPEVLKGANTKLKWPLSKGELRAALISMENGKTPGIDGLLVDFYKKFWGYFRR